jgi:hypothetical protein
MPGPPSFDGQVRRQLPCLLARAEADGPWIRVLVDAEHGPEQQVGRRTRSWWRADKGALVPSSALALTWTMYPCPHSSHRPGLLHLVQTLVMLLVQTLSGINNGTFGVSWCIILSPPLLPLKNMSPVQAYIDNAVRDLAHLQRGAAVTVTGHFGDVVSNNSTWIENVGTGRLGTPTDFGHIGYCFIGKHALAQDASFRDNDFGPPHKPFTKPISFEAKSRQIEFSLDAPAFGLEAGPVRHAVEAIQLAKAKTLSSVRQSLIVNNKMKLRFRTMEVGGLCHRVPRACLTWAQEVEEVDHSAAFAESDDEDAAKDGAGDANQAPRARLEQEEQFGM